jgi:hypothetical protein
MLPNARANGKPIREFTCSPAFALAAAIYQGYKRIEIYGVELSSNTEYHYQQGNFKYWLGVAAGRGIEVDIHSTMFDTPLYGYEGEVFLPYETFTDRIAELAQWVDEKRGKFIAAKKTTDAALKEFANGDNTKQLLPAVIETITHAHHLGEIDGAVQENQRYIDKADAMKAQGGEFVFSRQEFEASAARLNAEIADVTGQIQAMKGQLDIYHGSIVNAAKGSPKRDKILTGYRALLDNFIAAHNAKGLLTGAQAENYRYMSRLDAGIKAAGGVKSEEAILNG